MFLNLLITSIIYIKMCESTDVGEFFGTTNLALITWEHAVNDKTKLENTLKTDIQMLEADVAFGNLTGTPPAANLPIMAHPPAKTSNLSLEQFLNAVTEFNAKNPKHQKGIKLDFKSIEAFESSLGILRNVNQVPVWLNADIVKGPGNPQSPPVDATKFLAQAKRFPNTTLSVGWTTNYDAATTSNSTYTQDDVALMLDTLKTNGVNQSVTFPVRAVYAAESTPQLSELIANYSGATLTVWSAVDDQVNVKHLRKMILDIGVDKVYVDVPPKLMNLLDLSSAGARSTIGLGPAIFSAFLGFFIVFNAL